MTPETIIYALIIVGILFLIAQGITLLGRFFTEDLLCLHCGYIGHPKNIVPGNVVLELILWLLLIVPGLIYSVWRLSAKYKACPKCHEKNMIPLDSPRAEKFMMENNVRL